MQASAGRRIWLRREGDWLWPDAEVKRVRVQDVMAEHCTCPNSASLSITGQRVTVD